MSRNEALILTDFDLTHEVHGTHGSRIVYGPDGGKYLLKQQEPFRSYLDKAISDIQHATAYFSNRPRVELVHLEDNASPVATVHEWLEGEDAFPGAFDPHTLSDSDRKALGGEHVLDWLIANHDSHPGQFIRTRDGALVGIDKGQAFKHFGTDFLHPTYHPNTVYGEREPVYNTLAASAPLYPDSDAIQQLQAIPESLLEVILTPYSVAAAKRGFLAKGTRYENNPDGFIAAVCMRKVILHQQLPDYWLRIRGPIPGLVPNINA